MLSRPRDGRDERGTVGINLVIVLAFALYAVIQLTRTTVAAQQIDHKVVTITGSVGPIDTNLNAVPKLDKTNETAQAIRAAAAPLSGDAQNIIDAAHDIDGTVDGINASATAINGTVHGIAGNVSSIQSSVHGIGGSVGTLKGVVDQIQQGIVDINHRADIIIGGAQQINADLGNVAFQVGGPGNLSSGGSKNVAGHAQSIDCTVAHLTLQQC
jgi:methyl-accepting chemotaxis protein